MVSALSGAVRCSAGGVDRGGGVLAAGGDARGAAGRAGHGHHLLGVPAPRHGPHHRRRHDGGRRGRHGAPHRRYLSSCSLAPCAACCEALRPDRAAALQPGRCSQTVHLMACAASVMVLLYGDCSVLASTLELCCSPESAAHVAFSTPAMGVLAACAAHSHCGHGRATARSMPAAYLPGVSHRHWPVLSMLGPLPVWRPSPAVQSACYEDALLPAGASTCMVHLTGNPVYDAVGSITISGLLGCTAIFLIQQNRSLLLGKPLCHPGAS